MAHKVLLVGHCGPDNTYLRMAVKAAIADVSVVSADDTGELEAALRQSVDLVLLNRQLDGDFDPPEGVEMVATLRRRFPNLRMMLISNYPQSQAQAVAAGALPGFGKRQIGTTQVKQLLRDALAGEAAKPAREPIP